MVSPQDNKAPAHFQRDHTIESALGMDFVSDSLADDRTFRVLAIADHYTREGPVIEVDLSLPGARVLRVLERRAKKPDYRKPFA